MKEFLVFANAKLPHANDRLVMQSILESYDYRDRAGRWLALISSENTTEKQAETLENSPFLQAPRVMTQSRQFAEQARLRERSQVKELVEQMIALIDEFQVLMPDPVRLNCTVITVNETPG